MIIILEKNLIMEKEKDEKDEEILKRKRIRKNLLLKVNEEIKEISDSKPTLLINSKTMDELGKVYNRSNILLIEKGIVYSNYIKTEIRIYPNKKITPIYREKSVKNKVEKSNYKLEINGPSYEEEAASPIINFIPKKINLGTTKIIKLDKRYTKNNGSIQKYIENNLNAEKEAIAKEDQLNKSLRIEKSNMNKLIEKILAIKNTENMESIIKSNIKKLRKYCYKFRIKKKKRKNKSQEPKSNLNVISSNKLSAKKYDKERKSSPFKIIPHPSNKKQKKFSNLNILRKLKKLKTLNEEDGKSAKIVQSKNKSSKPIKTSENINTNKSNNNSNNSHYVIKVNNSEEEPAPDLHNIKRELMRSVINERPSKYYFHQSKFSDKNEKHKQKINKKKNNLKKMIMRKVSAFNPKEIEKIKFSMKKIKRDKLELDENAYKNNSNNSTNNSPYKSENKNTNNNNNNNISIIINNSFNQSLSKIKKINDSKKRSKKKIIESPNRKNDNYSNCNTNNNTNIITLTQSSIEKHCKNSIKKSQNKVY